uniref:PH domain-containing protein n=1 Tax=Angiostrongylus cantonensis TaxID=6313 RepID=A0A158P6Z8_ANGCA
LVDHRDHTAFNRLKEIFNTPHYVERRVDQSVVEIVIARITAAIRLETGCIETYSAELVDVLDSCLKHPMTVLNSAGEHVDSPHCKIASDLLSSLFLHYAKRSVMTLTLPVAMKAVGSSNQDLVKNTTSYISLAAIHNGKALSYYALQIISYIINGNHSLLRVLPQVYAENREPFHAHIPQLLAVLREADCSEKLSLLQLASMIANEKPELLIPHLPQFDQYLMSLSTCTAVLNIYMSLISQGRAYALAPFLLTLSKACQQPEFSGNLATIFKIMGNIGRVSLPLASDVLDELVKSALYIDEPQFLSSILTEIEVISLILCPKISLSSGPRTVFPVCESPTDCSALELDRNTHSLAMQYQNRSSGSLPRRAGHASASHSLQGFVFPVISSEMMKPRMLGSSTTQPRTHTLPAGFAPHTQIGRDGRVRPMGGNRRAANWASAYETTFPANSGPVTTTKMHPLAEEEERQWLKSVDRSDVVLQFVDHRRNKLRRYVSDIASRFPIPIQCTVEGSKHRMIVHFSCQVHNAYCAFHDDYMFAFKTKFAAIWLHLMFLQMQSTSIENECGVVSQSAAPFVTLARCWQCLPARITKDRAFVTLVTSAFPTVKEQDKLYKELEEASFFDCFSLDGPSNRWSCFSCSHPDRVKSFVEEGGSQRVLEGQLKEKKGRWRFLRRWHTKYFTLSSAALTYSSEEAVSSSSAVVPAIDLRSIRSVRSLSRGRKSRKSLRRAFEIFTSDNTSVVLKTMDMAWLHRISIKTVHVCCYQQLIAVFKSVVVKVRIVWKYIQY